MGKDGDNRETIFKRGWPGVSAGRLMIGDKAVNMGATCHFLMDTFRGRETCQRLLLPLVLEFR